MSEIEERFVKTREILSDWVNKQGHERCWYYPDLFKQLAEVLDVKISKEPRLPPIEEFEEGCRRYQMEEYKTNKG